MSKRIDYGSPNLELRLNLSAESSSPVKATLSDSSSGTAIDDISSCLSSEPDEDHEILTSSTKSKNNDSVEDVEVNQDTAGMVLVGCPRCLMYVILSEVNPKCPICKSSVLLHLLSEVNNWSTK